MDIKKILFKTNDIDVEKSLPDAVIFCSKDGKIQWVNDKTVEIFQTSKMHLLTSNIGDFIENIQNLIDNSVILNKKVITKLIGKETYFDMTSKEIDEGFVLAFRNADNIIASEDCTSIANKIDSQDKNAFLVKLTNDFKSPLQSIIGFSQAMSDGLGGEMSEQQEKYIRIIKKNSTELMNFINKLIDLSQTELGVKSPDLKTFDVVNTINSLVRFNEQLHKDKDVRWKVQVDENLRNTIVSDEEFVKNIVQNILEVILKSIEMGEILVNLSIPSEESITSKNLFGSNFIQISVSSSSLLLSENDLEYLFEPYEIIDSSNRKNLLRAIILACVKNLVQSLNGIVWVESQILKNTSFNIIIPQGNNLN